jgi:hypothetical protein
LRRVAVFYFFFVAANPHQQPVCGFSEFILRNSLEIFIDGFVALLQFRIVIENKKGQQAKEEKMMTPLTKQFITVKEKHPNALVLLRLGDFCETFFDDAKTVAKILGITLTAKCISNENPIPLTGFPVTALGAYCKKLSDAGRDVFIFSSFAKLEEK